MIEWSDADLMIRDAVREFSAFAIDVMAAEATKNMLDRERARQSAGEAESASRTERGLSGRADQASMAAIVVGELAGVSLGTMAALGVSIGLGAVTIMQRGKPWPRRNAGCPS